MKAVFRAWKGSGEPFAIFPEFSADPRGRRCISVDRNGHAAADYNSCILGSRPAKPEEVEKAWLFLATLGYHREDVQPVARVHQRTHRERQEALCRKS